METHQIEKKLCEMESFDEEFISENGCPEFCALTEEYMKRKGISKAELIKRLNVNRNYGYQFLNGTRIPKRSYVIQIGLLLEISIDQLQKLLKAADRKPLYVRNIFDAKVFYALSNKMNYDEAVQFIWGNRLNDIE